MLMLELLLYMIGIIMVWKSSHLMCHSTTQRKYIKHFLLTPFAINCTVLAISGTSLWCTTFVHHKAQLGVLHISHKVYNNHHVHSPPSLQQTTCASGSLGVLYKSVFASRCTAYAIMYTRKHTLVFCIPLQIYNRHHVHQEPHLVYCSWQ